MGRDERRGEPLPYRSVELIGPVRAVSAAEYAVDDERALRLGRPAARVAVVRDRAVSFGVGVRLDPGFLGKAEREGVPTIRRTSGGSGLLHEPGDLFWSIVLPRTDPRAGADFRRAFGRLGTGAVRFLARRGLAAAWTAAPGAAPDYCTLSERGEVLSVDGRIVGGAAQHVTSSALLHHATISTELDRSTIDRLFDLPSPGPTQRLASLRELGLTEPPEELGTDLADAILDSLASD